MRKLVIALALTAASGVTARAAPINVVPSSPLTFNGFTFDNFSCLIQTNTGIAGPIDCGQITVSQASSNAITIGGAFFANTPPSISTEDVKIGYRVTSTMPITGVSLDFNASTLNNAFANVTESLGTTQASSNLGQMVVRAPVGPSSTTAAITPPETTIWVTKDLLLNATVLDEIATNNVTFSLVNQDFEVPEPMSLGLLAGGFAGLIAFGRRRRPHF